MGPPSSKRGPARRAQSRLVCGLSIVVVWSMALRLASQTLSPYGISISPVVKEQMSPRLRDLCDHSSESSALGLLRRYQMLRGCPRRISHRKQTPAHRYVVLQPISLPDGRERRLGHRRALYHPDSNAFETSAPELVTCSEQRPRAPFSLRPEYGRMGQY